MQITDIRARQVIDSRGEPTVEAEVRLDDGSLGRAAVPSGASTGAHEAHELRDGGPAYGGKGVLKAVANAQGEIAHALKGVSADDQFLIDQKMIDLDGTPDKSRLGANAILAVSLACAHATAAARKLPLYHHVNDIAHGPDMSLPMPMMNILNGGKHAIGSSDFQEFMIIPVRAESYAQAVQIGCEVYQALKKIIEQSGHLTAVGDEGGFTYPVQANTDMLDLLNQAVDAAGYHPGSDVVFAIDVAASELFNEGMYTLKTEQRQLSTPDMIDYLKQITEQYPVVSIEDGLAQDEWDAWATLTEQLGPLQLVGDDLLVTNTTRLQEAIDRRAANTILIKPNQIGTLTETIRAVQLAAQHGWRSIISHRSGETEDTTIAHIAVGTGAGQIKTGSLARSERTAKHNELLRIESQEQTLHLARPFTTNR
jgi:enolase